jgi:vacuolar-type H+-ATPase catalytic subunit A/Vma1
MSKNDLLTVKEFAELAGVSRQAVNSACKRKLTEYVNIVDGQKRLHKDGLELYGLQLSKPTCKLNSKLRVNQPSTSLHDESDNVIDTLKQLEKQMDILERQSRIFEKQLDIKDNQLKAKDRQLEEMSERLKEAHELNRNNQILLGQQQKLLEQFEQPVAQDLDVVAKKTEMVSDKISFLTWLKQKFNI